MSKKVNHIDKFEKNISSLSNFDEFFFFFFYSKGIFFFGFSNFDVIERQGFSKKKISHESSQFDTEIILFSFIFQFG